MQQDGQCYRCADIAPCKEPDSYAAQKDAEGQHYQHPTGTCAVGWDERFALIVIVDRRQAAYPFGMGDNAMYHIQCAEDDQQATCYASRRAALLCELGKEQGNTHENAADQHDIQTEEQGIAQSKVRMGTFTSRKRQ